MAATTLAALQREAQRQRRTVSNLIEVMVLDQLDKVHAERRAEGTDDPQFKTGAA